MLLLYIAGAITAVAATSYVLYQQHKKSGGKIDFSKFIKLSPGPALEGAVKKPKPSEPKKEPTKETREHFEIIRKTILEYVEKEMKRHLEETGFSKEKSKEVTDLVADKIEHILSNMDLSILVPQEELKTKEQMESHILKIIESIKPRLMDELDKAKEKTE